MSLSLPTTLSSPSIVLVSREALRRRAISYLNTAARNSADDDAPLLKAADQIPLQS
jgi:hypothetical protein